MRAKLVSSLFLISAGSTGLLSQQFSFDTINHPLATDTYVTAISGQTLIGYYQNTGSANSNGFIYKNGTFSALGGSIAPGVNFGITSLQPLGISGNTIVGGELYTVGGTPGLGFIYDISSSTYTLMPQGFGGVGMKPTGISNNLIVGYAGQILPPGNFWRKHSFTFDGVTYSSPIDYPDPLSLYEGIAYSTQAQGTNGTQIVGSYLIPDYNPLVSNASYHGFLLSNGAWTTLNAPGAFNTYAQGISDSNIVGYFNDLLGVHGYVFDGSNYAILDVPGALETRAMGISGDTIVGTYLDSNGITKGFSTVIPVAQITTVINQSDPRVTGNKSLIFNNGTLATSNALTINAPVSVVAGSTGTINSENGNVIITSTPIVGQNGVFIVSGGINSSTTLLGGIGGLGTLTVTSGTNSIRGLNSSAGTIVAGGILTVMSTSALPLTNNYSGSGSIVLSGEVNGANIFTQSLTLDGAGYESQGALIVGTQTQSNAVESTGPINILSNSIIGISGPAGSSRLISGAIIAASPGKQLSLIATAGTHLSLQSVISPNIERLSKSGNGLVVLENTFSFAGLIEVNDGRVALIANTSPTQATTVIQGGSLLLPNNITPGQIAAYSLDVMLGSESSSELVLGSENSLGSMSLSGAITTSGLTPKIKVYGTSGYQQITANISSATPGASLELNTNSGSNLIIGSNISEFLPFINKTGAGHLNINGQIFGSLTSNGGTVTISPNGSIGATGNVFANTSLVIESNLSGERQFGSRLSLSGNGPTGASLTIGTPNANGIVTLTSSIDIVGPSVIRTPNSGVTSVNFNGPINATGQNLTIEINSLSDATISSTLIASRLDKNEGGLLTISGSASASIYVNGGTLKVNGSINGSVTVLEASKLKGSGTINGNVANSGIISPGNSPGILSINGSYTATTGSRYDAEIAGLGGAGALNGHDSIVVSGLPGTYSIQSGAGLNVIKLNGFEPAKGASFRIINAAGGITGTFSTFTSQFNQWVLFDKATGVIYGTELSAGQTFSSYSPSLGQVIWQNSVNSMSNDPLNGYAGTFDSTTPWGNAALSILRGESLPGSADGSPFAALGFVNHAELRDDARSTFNTLQSRRFDRVAANRSAWEPYIQYSYLKASAGGNPTTFDLNSSGISVGMLCDIGAISTVGFGITSHDSSTTFGNNHGTSKGSSFAFVAMASTMLDEISRKVYVDAGIQLGNSTHKTTRTTFLGQQYSDIRSENLGAFVRIGTGIELSKSLSATTYAGLDFVHTKVPSFKETGDVTALTVDIKPSNSMQLQVGTDIDCVIFQGSLKTRLSLGAEAFVEILSGNKYDISYSYSGTPSLLADGKLNPKTGLRVSPRLEFSRNSQSCYYLNATFEMVSGNSQSSINLGYKTKF